MEKWGDDGAVGSVTGINLNNNNINGGFPEDCWAELPNLEVLDLGNNNNLYTNMPDYIGNCTNLRVLNLADTFISGGVIILIHLGSNDDMWLTSHSWTIQTFVVCKI